MTKEEAIKIIKDYDVYACGYCHQGGNEVEDVFDMAIKALEQEPCEDAISRQAVIDTIERWLSCDAYNEAERHIMRAVRNILYEFPPVTPQPKTGHWIYDYTSADGHRVYHCSKCGCYLAPKHNEPSNSFKWCNLCGAKMVDPQEREDMR